MEPHWIDLSHPLSAATAPFPGDPPVEIQVLNSTRESDRNPRTSLNSSRLSLCVHCGTHMDAPYHFFGNGTTIDRVAIDACVGPALLATIPYLPGRTEIDVEDLSPFANQLRLTKRFVLNTGWYRRWGGAEYFTSHPILTKPSAEYLVSLGLRLIGVDFPSVDRPPHEAHLELLGNGVVIVENLTNLDQIPRPQFELIALPLAIVGRDGSPVRAVAQV